MEVVDAPSDTAEDPQTEDTEADEEDEDEEVEDSLELSTAAFADDDDDLESLEPSAAN